VIAAAILKSCRRGKSELRRAGCRVTPGEGDFKDSATEIYRQTFYSVHGIDLILDLLVKVMIGLRGKDGKAR